MFDTGRGVDYGATVRFRENAVGSIHAAVRALGTSSPQLYVSQRDVFEFLCRRFTLAAEEEELYRRLLTEGPVRGRFFGMDSTEDALESDPDRLNARFLKAARAIGADAARRAVAEAGMQLEDVGGIVVNTCTGYVCPGLSSYLAGDLGLPSAIKTADLAGMGCGGALPNLECAAGWIAAGCARPVLSVAVEICSATLFMGNEPGLIVSNSIFGDGAAACVLDGREAEPGPALFRLLDFESAVFPEHRDALRYRQDGGRLRNVLTRRVPAIGSQCARTAVERLLQRNGLSVDGVKWWAAHAGGSAVLDHLGEGLGLGRERLRHSSEIFSEYGNMSSASVLFAMRRVLDAGRPSPGEKGVLVTFGAGFSAFSALVEFGTA